MAARKKQEVAEEAGVKKPAAKKPKVVPAAQPESVAVPADMLAQLMAQIQTLTQEVGELRNQVVTPEVEPVVLNVSMGAVTQDEIDFAEANPDLMPDDFFSAEIEADESSEANPQLDALAFEERNPGLLGEIANFNADETDVHPPVSQSEIDEAEAHPDEMPSDFFAGDVEREAVETEPIDVLSFESKNPGLLGEIEQFNATLDEPLSLELTQEEIDLAQANPVEIPADFFEAELTETQADCGEVDAETFEVNNPGLLAEIAAFNEDGESDDDSAITAEEAGALLSGFDAAMQEIDAEVVPDDGPVSADDIAAMFASVESSAPVEAVPDDGPVSADDIAAMFASVDSAAPAAAVPDDGPVSADDIAAMFASVENSAPAAVPDDGPVSADDIAALFASAESATPEVSSEALSDDEIAQAIELGAMAVDEPVASEAEEEFAEDLDDLTEEDLVALIRQNIEVQAEVLDEREAEEAAEAEAMAEAAEAIESGAGVMSAAEIAALLATPDEEGDVVPLQSSAMSDEELRALLSEAESGEGSPAVPTADDLGDVSFVREQAVAPAAKAKPVSAPKPPTGEAELGAIKAVPAHLAVRAMALPVRFEDGKILCKVAEPIDRAALDQLSKTVGFGVIIEPTPIDEVVVGLRVAYAEFQDFNARFAVMSGAQNRSGLVEKISNMWKKPA